jgi:hypothetical protein
LDAAFGTPQVWLGVWLIGVAVFSGRYLLGRWLLGRVRRLAAEAPAEAPADGLTEWFEKAKANLGVLRVDAPNHSLLGLSTGKGIGFSDWRPEKTDFEWMEPLVEASFCYSDRPADDGAAKPTTYYPYHRSDLIDREQAFLRWLGGEEASEIITRHGFVPEAN